MASQDTLDFVIVGGGTAGLVLAARLTEDPKTTVAVLEAGSDRLDDPKIKIPGLASTLYGDPLYEHSHVTVPQSELYNKTIQCSTGKMLGGSSAINVMNLVYPSKSAIDSWSKLGNSGWDWNGLQPYYRKFNTYNPPTPEQTAGLSLGHTDSANYGSSGPIQGSYSHAFGPMSLAWIDTFAKLGVPASGDPLSGIASGAYNSTSSIDPRTKERSHAGSAYLAPNRSRPNLSVITDCMVTRLQLDTSAIGSGPKATGVFTTIGGQVTVFHAKKEVLLCAGTFRSPQILELSGIGDPDILSTCGIQVKAANVNVGTNLQDHTCTGFSLEAADGVPTIDMIRDPEVAGAAFQAYMTDRSGPLTSTFHWSAKLPLQGCLVEPGQTEFLKVVDRELAAVQSDTKKIQLQHDALRAALQDPNEPTAFLAGGPVQAHFDASTTKDVFGITDPRNFISVILSVSHPFSRGTIHIRSSNAGDLPEIDPRYYSNPVDLEMTARHLLWLLQLRTTQPLADYLKPQGGSIPSNLNLTTIEEAKEHIRRNTYTFWHACGTCAMLPEASGGVVDDRLRVYGVSGLRVVDASVMPMIPSVNIQSTVYALAEKAADLIKDDYDIKVETI